MSERHLHSCPECYEPWLCDEGCHIEPDLGVKEAGEHRGLAFSNHEECPSCRPAVEAERSEVERLTEQLAAAQDAERDRCLQLTVERDTSRTREGLALMLLAEAEAAERAARGALARAEAERDRAVEEREAALQERDKAEDMIQAERGSHRDSLARLTSERDAAEARALDWCGRYMARGLTLTRLSGAARAVLEGLADDGHAPCCGECGDEHGCGDNLCRVQNNLAAALTATLTASPTPARPEPCRAACLLITEQADRAKHTPEARARWAERVARAALEGVHHDDLADEVEPESAAWSPCKICDGTTFAPHPRGEGGLVYCPACMPVLEGVAVEPAAQPVTNGGIRCDVTDGPCACGAWHEATPRAAPTCGVCNDRGTVTLDGRPCPSCCKVPGG